jgi:hypothetical protein
MTEQQHLDAFRRELRDLKARAGRGRARAFAEAVDLSPAGVNAWRAANGLAPLPVCPKCGRLVNDRSGAFCRCPVEE